jgi:hypothetical protein
MASTKDESFIGDLDKLTLLRKLWEPAFFYQG